MATVVGTSGNDSNLQGTTASDLVFGFQGNDTITGNGGNDSLIGGKNADSITFGIAGIGGFNAPGFGGNDLIYGDEGSDTIVNVGSNGRNTISGGTGNATIDALIDGSDLIIDTVPAGSAAPSGNDLILGDYGNDTVTFSGGASTIFGGMGFDSINAVADATGTTFGSNDVIFGGEGGDTINFAASGINSIVGGTGNAAIDSTADGADLITITAAGAGNSANDLVLGNYGNDTIDASAQGTGTDTLVGGYGDDTITSGTQANDIILGNQGNDLITTGANATGTETVYGGMGDDTINPGSNAAGYVGGLTFGGEGNDIITDFGTGNDTIFGGVDSIGAGDGNNLIDISGNTSGNDLLFGGSGNDSLNTGFTVATDTVTGGAGADTFAYTGTSGTPGAGSAYGPSASAGLDVITDFVSGTDKIADQTVPGFLGLLFGGPVANAFVLNSTVTGGAGNVGAGNAEAAAALLGGGLGQVNAVLFQTVTGGDHYLVVDNDATGGFSAGDLLVDLKNATSIAKSDFV